MKFRRLDKPLDLEADFQSTQQAEFQGKSVVIFEPKEVFLEALIAWVLQHSRFTIVEGSSKSIVALDQIFEINPNLVICSIDEQFSNYEFIREANVLSEQSNIAYLASEISDHKVMKLLHIQRHSIINISDRKDCFLSLMEQVANGQVVFSECYEDILKRFRTSQTNPWNLSERQMQVLEQLAKGNSVKETACNLSLSVKSVDSHKYRIMKKLNVHDRVHLSRLAIREGLIDP